MKKHSKNILFMAATVASALALAPTTQAEDHKAGVWAMDQSVGNGVVSARKVVAEENGWLVVHRTDSAMKPGPVVAHAPLRAGKNMDVAAILTEEVSAGDMLMLMVHSEAGGNQTGIFEYTLGAKEDGPIRKNGKLVTKPITVQ